MLLLVLFDLSILYQYTVLYMINKYKIGCFYSLTDTNVLICRILTNRNTFGKRCLTLKFTKRSYKLKRTGS